VQEIDQIDCAEGRVDGFATSVAADSGHPAVGTIYNEITEFRQLNAARRLKSKTVKA